MTNNIKVLKLKRYAMWFYTLCDKRRIILKIFYRAFIELEVCTEVNYEKVEREWRMSQTTMDHMS